MPDEDAINNRLNKIVGEEAAKAAQAAAEKKQRDDLAAQEAAIRNAKEAAWREQSIKFRERVSRVNEQLKPAALEVGWKDTDQRVVQANGQIANFTLTLRRTGAISSRQMLDVEVNALGTVVAKPEFLAASGSRLPTFAPFDIAAEDVQANFAELVVTFVEQARPR